MLPFIGQHRPYTATTALALAIATPTSSDVASDEWLTDMSTVVGTVIDTIHVTENYDVSKSTATASSVDGKIPNERPHCSESRATQYSAKMTEKLTYAPDTRSPPRR